MTIILSCFSFLSKGQKPNSAEFEKEIYYYLGKNLTNEELNKLNKKYGMKAYDFSSIRRFSNSFFEYQIDLDQKPHLNYIEVKNNDQLLPFNLEKSDNLKSIKLKFGEPTLVDLKEKSLYYFDKYLFFSFSNLEDSSLSFKSITFLEDLTSKESANQRKVFVEMSNEVWLRKKNLDSSKPDFPVAFGYKWFWYAVKSTDLQKIAIVLGLNEILPCNWEAGIGKAYEEGDIFLTPAVDGWTLVLGLLPNDNTQYEEIKKLLMKLSKEFGEAQFFCTHRVVEYHCWMKSLVGEMKRTYAYLGERGENVIIEGVPTSFESQYKLVNTFSDEAKAAGYFERQDILFPDEQFLMKVANNWSVNPSKLDSRKDLGKGLGIIGKRK